METRGRPRILLVSSWQTVNIGDVAHTPGALAAIEEFAPDAEVVLWAWRLGDRERRMLTDAFPRVRVIEGGPEAELPDDLIDACDLLVHGSAPSFVAGREIASWRRRTTKPYGFLGVTFDPLAPHHTFTLGDADTMIAAVDGDLLDPDQRAMLAGAAFVQCRESLSVRFLAGQQVGRDRVSFGPDATLAYVSGDRAAADRIISAHDLTDGEFLCVVPRLRFAPYHQMSGTSPTSDQIRKDAYNAGHVESDLGVLRRVIIDWVRDTGRQVLVVPEMAYAVDLAADRLSSWPTDVAPHVQLLPEFWSVSEASAVYARAAGLVSMDCHSPLLALAVGTPALYLRLPTETVKGRMYADLGAAGIVHEISPDPGAPIRAALQGLADDPEGARAEASRIRERGRAELARMVGELIDSTGM